MSENVSPLERRIDVAVTLQQLNQEVNKRLQRLAKTVKIHGFRPGKVPLKVVAQQYGAQVQQEALEETLQRRFFEDVKEKDLKVAGYPSFEAKPFVSGAQAVEYSAKFEVYPEIKLGDISGIAIERPVFEVGDKDIERTIDILRKQRATFAAVKRAAEDSDQVDVDYVGKIDGVAFEGGSAKSMVFILGQKRMLPEFEAAVVGMKAGESKSFDLTFPKDYQGKEVAGKKAVFELTLNRVEAAKLPKLDAEFAKALGVADGDLKKMRAEIEGNIKREVKRRLQSRIKEQVMQALLDSTKIELPNSLVQAEIDRLMASARQDLAARGMKDMPLQPSIFEEQAKRRVCLGLILAEIIKVHEIRATPEQVRAVIEELAENYEFPDEVIQWHYSSEERLNDAEAHVLEDNVVSWVMNGAKVKDKKLTFEELMGY